MNIEPVGFKASSTRDDFLSVESASMADALQEAKHALADAKLRIRVAEVLSTFS